MCISEEFDKETGQMLSGLDKLPPDLKEYVEGDNKLFEREMEEWDALQARKLLQEKLALAAAAAVASVAAQPMSTEPCPPDNTGELSLWTYCRRQPSLTQGNSFSASSTAPQHDPEYMEQQSPTGDSKHLQEDTQRAISKAAAEHDEKSPEALLTTVRHTQTHDEPDLAPSDGSGDQTRGQRVCLESALF